MKSLVIRSADLHHAYHHMANTRFRYFNPVEAHELVLLADPQGHQPDALYHPSSSLSLAVEFTSFYRPKLLGPSSVVTFSSFAPLVGFHSHQVTQFSEILR